MAVRTPRRRTWTDRYQTAPYNLKDDIAEEKNLAGSHPEKVKAMSKLLDQWEAEMNKTAAPFPLSEKHSDKHPKGIK